VEELASTGNFDVEVVYWPVNAQAPLTLAAVSGVKWIPKEEWNRNEAIQLDLAGVYSCVVVSGWGDPDYNVFAKSKGKSKRILAFDTQWYNSLKMLFGSQWMKWTMKGYYHGAWVPGDRQAKLARAMGFSLSEIATGFYVADLEGIAYSNRTGNSNDFKIGFVSRLVKEKGFPGVLEGMMDVLNDNTNWQVHVWGTGPLMDAMPRHDQIFYHGFTQPKDLKKVWSDLDVFVLASEYEPWGVVVHEAAGAGLPIIATTAVGAADAFVDHGKNGWVFPVGDTSLVCKALLELFQMSTEDRAEMRAISLEKSSLISIDQWCNTIKNWTS
jgi:glycosyltransferase involved in cell wall biosynthesis